VHLRLRPAAHMPLFRVGDQVESGTGWPAELITSRSTTRGQARPHLGMLRTEIHGRRCGGHIGMCSTTARRRPAASAMDGFARVFHRQRDGELSSSTAS